MKNSKILEACFGTWYYFSKSQADDWLSAFSMAELRFPNLYEVPAELEIMMRLPVKYPAFVSVFIEARRNLKSFFSYKYTIIICYPKRKR